MGRALLKRPVCFPSDFNLIGKGAAETRTGRHAFRKQKFSRIFVGRLRLFTGAFRWAPRNLGMSSMMSGTFPYLRIMSHPANFPVSLLLVFLPLLTPMQLFMVRRGWPTRCFLLRTCLCWARFAPRRSVFDHWGDSCDAGFRI